MVKIGYQWLAILVVVLGGVVVGAYTIATRDSADSAATAPPAGDTAAAAPAATAAPAADASKFMHFRVGNRNVKSIFPDGDTVWIGTSGGVIRYQAATDKESVFDNRVEGILSNGVFHVSKIGEKIFVGTYGGGLSVLDPATQKWRNYNIPDGLADQFVYDVEPASNGDLWIATWSGINRVRGGQLDDPAMWDLYTMENTQGGIPNPWVYSADEGPDGTMWFGTEEGLTRFKDGAWRHWKHSDGLGAPYELVRDAIKFTNDPAKASQHHARQKEEQGLQDVQVAYNPNYIISLAVDKQGVIWCGTWGGGLARFDGASWRNYTTVDGLPANHIFMLYIDPSDRLWIGTSGGLARMNEGAAGFTVMTTADGLFADNVFSMANTPDGSMWVGSFGGIAKIADRR